uniref:FYVE-type domain-containing protein n=1 Tax=Phytophthora ramorum TaxID=164328 RepID=H3HCR4_PHYRM
MASKRLDAVKLAKSSRWDELRRLVDAEPVTAQQVDAYGMLPLHWACTEPQSIGEGVLLALLKAFPQGARAPNTAEMLPLQIAIKAQARIEWLQALLASYPDAVLKKAPSGENAVQLARKAALPSRSIKLLEEMYHHLALEEQEKLQEQQEQDDEGQLRPSERFQAIAGDLPVPHLESGVQYGQRQRRLSSTASLKMRSFSDNDFYAQQMNGTRGPNRPSTTARPAVSLPPRWMNAPSCSICAQKFGTFKKRHHCRNCGQSICRDHSARERMKLPHYGLSDRHRVCVVCHDMLRNASRQARQQQITMQAAQRAAPQTRISQAMSGDARRSDEAQRSPPGMLERHVSAPARASNSGAGPYRPGNEAAINEQVATLQKQVSQLMEEKQQAETQLRVQAEMLSDPDRLTNVSRSSNTSGGSATSMPMARDRQNSLPMQMRTGSTPSAPLNQQQQQPSRSNSTAANPALQRTTRLQDALNTIAAVESTYDDIEGSDSDIEGRQTDIGDFHDAEADAEAETEAEAIIDSAAQAVVEAAKAANGAVDDEVEAESEDEVGGDTLPEVDVLVSLGHVMMEKGSVSAAVQAFTRAVEIRPDDPALHSLLGRAYYADENLDAAVASIAKSLDLEPSATNSTLLGKILFEKGDHEKAIAAYQRSLDMQNTAGSTYASQLLAHIRRQGFDGIEASLGDLEALGGTDLVLPLLTENELELIVGVYSGWVDYELQKLHQQYEGVENHVNRFRTQLEQVCSFRQRPVRINAHSGCDHWRPSEQMEFLRRVHDIERQFGCDDILAHETHRGRMFYSPWPTHWCVVTERLLDMPQDNEWLLEKVVPRVRHVHGRVGTEQAAQLPYPNDGELSRNEIERFQRLWDAIWTKQKDKAPTFTPEYGPVPYAPRHHEDRQFEAYNVDELCAQQATAQRAEFERVVQA